jgi:hypothetical protein
MEKFAGPTPSIKLSKFDRWTVELKKKENTGLMLNKPTPHI